MRVQRIPRQLLAACRGLAGDAVTWREEFAAVIDAATRDLPADMPLKERMAVVDGARPKQGYMSASWPQKAWQAVRR